MKRRQVLAATVGLLAGTGSGCVGILSDETTWDDLESLWVVFENCRDTESRVTVDLRGTNFQSNPVTVPAGDTYDWAYGLSDVPEEDEPVVSIQSQVGNHGRLRSVSLEELDCRAISVRAVLDQERIAVERECDQRTE